MQLGKLSLWETGRYDLAVESFDKVIALTNGDSSKLAFRIEAQLGKATSLFAMQDYEPALEIFKLREQYAVAGYDFAIRPLLFTYARTGNEDTALELLDDLRTGRQDNAALMEYLKLLEGIVYSNSGQKEKAAQVFSELAEAKPDEIEFRIQLAQVYIDSDDFEAALSVIEKAEQDISEPGNDLYLVKALSLERLGNRDEGIRILSSIVEENPDNHIALNNLGYAIVENGGDLELAKDYILRALELDPNQGSYLDSIGWIYFKEGNLVEAEKYLTRSVRTQYKSGEVREHLGYLYMAKNRKQEALRVFEAALANDLADIKPTDEVERHIAELRKALGIEQ
jgi:tetratricopeptide (TPR) repeat protein